MLVLTRKANQSIMIGDDIEVYNDVKDPVCDIIVAAAQGWALATSWKPGPSDA